MGSLLIARIMSPCSNKVSAFDPAKQPLTRRTCLLIGSFLARACTKNVKEIKLVIHIIQFGQISPMIYLW